MPKKIISLAIPAKTLRKSDVIPWLYFANLRQFFSPKVHVTQS